jgi:hypothetical protein
MAAIDSMNTQDPATHLGLWRQVAKLLSGRVQRPKHQNAGLCHPGCQFAVLLHCFAHVLHGVGGVVATQVP